MVDLTTTWLGRTLQSPIVLGASPLSHDVQSIVAAVEAGAGAVVMYSLFEEQVISGQMAAHHLIDAQTGCNAEASGFLADVDVFSLGAEPYLKQLQRLRDEVMVPVIALPSGTSPGGWTD
jgi:dihydroorotate dehydrogenase (fumarate)